MLILINNLTVYHETHYQFINTYPQSLKLLTKTKKTTFAPRLPRICEKD